jgi:hypothetical protein
MSAFHRLGRGVTAGRRVCAVLFACVAALAASALIVACGGTSNKSKDGLPSRAQAQADAVKFAKCMREHGIQAEVNTNEGGIQMRIGSPGEAHAGQPKGASEESSDATHIAPPGFEAAQRACQKYMPNEGKPIKLSPAEEAKQREDALKFARCMRSHGVDIPDPGTSGAVETPTNIDPQSATFQDAQRACHGLMGKLPLMMRASGAPGGKRFQSETARAGG